MSDKKKMKVEEVADVELHDGGSPVTVYRVTIERQKGKSVSASTDRETAIVKAAENL